MEKSFLINLKDELENTNLSDFTITVNNKTIIKVHKIILYCRSPVFKNMIDADMLEKKTNNINFNDVEESIVREFIKYIYLDECDLTINVYDVFRLAHLYEISDLVKKCKDYMLKELSVENITDTLKLVNIELYNLYDLKYKTEDFIKSHSTELINNNKFIDYYLEILRPDNFFLMFELVMKSNNSDLKLRIKECIKTNGNKIFQYSSNRNLLKSNSRWALEIIDYIFNINEFIYDEFDTDIEAESDMYNSSDNNSSDESSFGDKSNKIIKYYDHWY